MRVALFSNTAEPKDGYGNITVELTRALSIAGINCTLFLPRSQKDTADRAAFSFPVSCTLPEYVYRIFQPKGLGYFRAQNVAGFDLIHDLFAFPYCIAAAASSRKHGIPFVTGAQGTHGVRPLSWFPERQLLKYCYGHARGIAVPSEFTKQKIHELSGKEYPITVIHNGVHFERFQKSVDSDAVRKKHAGKKILLTVGGLWGRKGHDLVLKALPAILKKHPETVYMIVGNGDLRGELETLANALNIRGAVDFAGRKSGDDLVACFQACDIYVHTPRITGLKFEGFGIVYLEASACGKPIVATDAGGIRDAVLDSETGLIASDGDVNGIAERVIRLLDDQTLAKNLGERGCAYAKEHDWKKIAGKYLDWYGNFLHPRE